MKSRRRVPIQLALTALLGTVLFGVYLQVGLLPTTSLREHALRSIRQATHQPVSFSKAIYLPGVGFSMDDFRIDRPGGPPLFSAKHLRVDVRVLPFLIEKKIIVRNVLLDSPLFDWSPPPPAAPAEPIRTQISGQIAVPVAPASKTVTLSALEAEGADAFLPENVYLEQIEIRHGRAHFRGPDGALRETIEITDLKMNYRKPPVVDFDGEIRAGLPVYATLRLHGGWDLEKARYDFFLRVHSDRVPAWLDDFQQKHILILKKGAVDLTAKLSSITETRAAFHAKAGLSDSEIRVAHTSILGKAGLDAKGIFDFDQRTFERYKGTLRLDSVILENLSPHFPKIDNVSGLVGFEPDLVRIASLRGQWKKLAFEAAGSIRSFKELLLDGEIRSHLDIQDALALIPAEQKKLLAGFRIGGACEALTTLKGSLKKGGVVSQEHRLVIDRGFIENPERKIKLEDWSAELLMSEQNLRIRNCRFRSDRTVYQLAATIPKAPASQGTASLSSPAWQIQADYEVEDQNLRIRKGNARGYGAKASFTGRVLNVQDPSLELQGNVSAQISELLTQASNTGMKALRNWVTDGSFAGPFTLSGPWNRPALWKLAFDAHCSRLTFKNGFHLDNVESPLHAENGVLSAPHLRARIYGGTVLASYEADFTREPNLFRLRFSGNDLDLSEIAAGLPPPRQPLEGKLVFQLELSGPVHADTRWTGKGSIGIANGQFGRTDRFKDMGKLPLVHVEGMDDVTFHQLRATFDIRDRKIWTQDLSIFGDKVYLYLDGTVAFDWKLDLGMQIHYSKNVLDGALDTGGIVPFVVSEADNMISDYRVKGTLTAPVFEKSVLPVNPVKSVTKKLNTLAKTIVR